MIRLYVPDLPLAPDGQARLEGDRHHYLSRVLRVRPGTAVELFCGDGDVFRATVLSVERHASTIAVDSAHPGQPASPLRVVLLQSLLRRSRLELAVQKATELGVAEVRLVETSRCTARRPGGQRLQRLRTIAAEAAEQCGRAEVPAVLAPASLDDALSATPEVDARLVLWEEARHASLAAALPGLRKPAAIALLCGPEGGLSADEVARAEAADYRAVGLGPRILRAETAPLVALAVLQFGWGDWGDRGGP